MTPQNILVMVRRKSGRFLETELYFTETRIQSGKLKVLYVAERFIREVLNNNRENVGIRW